MTRQPSSSLTYEQQRELCKGLVKVYGFAAAGVQYHEPISNLTEGQRHPLESATTTILEFSAQGLAALGDPSNARRWFAESPLDVPFQEHPL